MDTLKASLNGSQAASYAVVVGGANTDIIGFSDNALIGQDSNPGRVCVSSGGVGRNIAENLARVGVRTKLLTAFGGDGNAEQLSAGCKDAGIDVSHSLTVEDLPGSVYLAIADEYGTMELGLNDMRSLERIIPEALQSLAPVLAQAAVIVLDTNVGPRTLDWVCSVGADVPIVLDPVSVTKSVRALSCLPHLHTLKANEIEARALIGDALSPEESIGRVSQMLLSAGVFRVMITMGAEGVHLAQANETEWIAAPAVEVVSDTGAGDAFAAGVAWGAMMGSSLTETARLATAMAALTLKAESTVDSAMSRSAVENMMEEIQ
jgi:pseudouridine kinase